MSGRHSHKQKREPGKDKVASTGKANIRITPEVTDAKAEHAFHDPDEELGKTVMSLTTMRKPDPFDLALYGLIITVVVAVIYFFQLRSMQDSVELARKNMQIDQRAWLGVTEVAVAPQLREGVVFNPTAYAANSGKTPALNVTQIAGWKKIPANEQIDCAYEVSTRKPIDQGVIQPNAKRELSPAFSGALSKEVADELTSGRFRFYMFGKITYDDIFRSRHETTFCMRLDTAGNAAFSPFGAYNNAN